MTVDGVSTGTFTLSFGGVATGSLTKGTSEATVQSELEMLSTIGVGNVTVSLSTDINGVDTYAVTFQNALGGQDVTELVATSADLTTAVNTVTQGKAFGVDATSVYFIADVVPFIDTYSVVLTSQPDQDVIVNVNPVATRTTRGELVSFVEQVEVSSPTLTFTPDNWDTPQIVTVRAIDDNFVDGGDTKVFADKPRVVNRIRGPLSITGGVSDTDLSIADPLLLPPLDVSFETNIKPSDGVVSDSSPTTLNVKTVDLPPGDVVGRTVEITEGLGKGQVRLILDAEEISTTQTVLTLNAPWETDPTGGLSRFAITNASLNFFVDEDDQIDTVTVFNTDSVRDETAVLTATRLTGLGMGPDTLIGDKLLPGGVTYNDVESLTLNLGTGSDQITVESTHEGTTTLNTEAGQDVINVLSTSGHTFINTGSQQDTINVGGREPLATGVQVDRVRGLLAVDAGQTSITGVATAAGASTLTDSTASFPIERNADLRGLTVTIVSGAGMGETRRIISNDATSFTIGDSASESFVLAGGSSVTLGNAPVAGSVVVTLNGEVVDPADITITGSDVTIASPVSGAVEVTYDFETTWNTGVDSAYVITDGDIVNVDDSGDTDDNLGLLTRTTLTGLDMRTVNEIQNVTVDASGGTFALDFAGVSTGPLAYNISAADLQSQLEALATIGVGNVDVTKADNVYIVRFQGDLTAIDLPQLTHLGTTNLVAPIDGTGSVPDAGRLAAITITTRLDGLSEQLTTEIQTLLVNAQPNEQFTLSFDSVVSGLLNHDADATAIEAALESIGTGDVQVGVENGLFIIKFIGRPGDNVPQIVPGGDGPALVATLIQGTNEPVVDDVQTVTVNGSTGDFFELELTTVVNEVQSLTIDATGGDFTVTLDGQTTATPVAFDVDAAGLQTALESLSTIGTGNVQVTQAGAVFTIEFIGALADQDVSKLEVDASGLIKGSGGGVVVVSTRVEGGGQTFVTDPIAVGADAFDVENALQAAILDSVFDSDIAVTKMDAGDLGDVYVVNFQGVLRQQDGGRGVGQLVARAVGGATIGLDVATRMDGISYYGADTLNIDLGSGSDIFNVQGTTAVTNVNLHDGGTLGNSEQIYVSSDADIDRAAAGAFDLLIGHLDDIQGVLNLDAGAGRHRLMISDEATATGDSNVVITDQPVLGLGLPTTDITVTGLAPAAMTYKTDAGEANNFADGITYWTSGLSDTITIDGTHLRGDGATLGTTRTITTLNTGEGGDTVNATLTDGQDGFFVLNTQGGDDTVDATASSLPLVVFGGLGRDTIDSGTGADIIFGDLGRVHYLDGTSGLVARLGGGGHGDLTDGVVRDPNFIFNGDPNIIENDGMLRAVGSNDQVTGGDGRDIILGGGNDDVTGDPNRETLDGGNDNDLILGDFGAATLVDNIVTRIESTDTDQGGDDTIRGQADNDIIVGGMAADTIDAAEGHNIVLGDSGVIDYVLADGDSSDLDLITSIAPDDGGVDDITAGSGDDVVIGGDEGDMTINAGDGANLVIGDSGTLTAAVAIDTPRQLAGQPMTLDRVETIAVAIGGDDTIVTGNNVDIVLGGIGGDDITTNAADDVVLGDNGYIDWLETDSDASDIDIITTTDPNDGGGDTIDSGSDDDFVLGGTGNDRITAGADEDLVFGDHGKVEGDINADLLPLATLSPAFTFTAIDIQIADDGGDDVIFGNAGQDILLGQQGSDAIFGGSDDDDIIGGHNVPGGHDAGDRLDGGSGDDVIAGDNATIDRRGDALSPRVRILPGTAIYDANGLPVVDAAAQLNPTGVAERDIVLLDHSDTPAADTHGNDYIAGGADDDVIFGQLGDDVIQGDGAVVGEITIPATDVVALREGDGTLTVIPSSEAAPDGDDYIEGNGGNDVVFGNLGQDDIIGGSSQLFGLGASEDLRPDGQDTLFGGAGTRIERNHAVDASNQGDIVLNERHARDSDAIVGDNGNIYRLVEVVDPTTTQFREFNYDQTSTFEDRGTLRVIPRAIELVDYTPGGPAFDPAAANDIGAADEVHGESGDDFIYGQVGMDVLFGDSEDDDIIGGYDSDWVSGGSGEDGVLGDDGRIYASRNGQDEPLNRLDTENDQESIGLPGPFVGAVVSITGRLTKAVDLTPFEAGSADIIYGGLGDDFLHGGAGDDAMSGAEALATFFDVPVPDADPLGYDPVTRKLAAYDADNPRTKIAGFLLNFEATDPITGAKVNDGKDRLFGDLGNDWLVGGTLNDRLFGGFGDDLLNADDNHDNGTAASLNDRPDDPEFADADFAFGGAGLDVLIANTGGDRLFDWIAEFNSYIVPFAPFGIPTIFTSPGQAPGMIQFLLDLGAASGADITRTEPDGELGLVTSSDPQWGDQSGSPRDPQPGNIPGVAIDTQGAKEDDTAVASSSSSGGGSNLTAALMTYTSSGPVTLVDEGTVFSSIVITDSATIFDLNVELNITHTRDSDLDVFLHSPDGTVIELFSDVGGNGDGFDGTVFDDDATESITAGSAPFVGAYRPEGDLSLFEAEDILGTWMLEIRDDKKQQIGVLDEWSLLFEL